MPVPNPINFCGIGAVKLRADELINFDHNQIQNRHATGSGVTKRAHAALHDATARLNVISWDAYWSLTALEQ